MKLPKLPYLRLRRPGQKMLSDAIEAAGLACIDGAVWWWQPVAGLAVLGGLLVFVGWVIDSESAPQGNDEDE